MRLFVVNSKPQGACGEFKTLEEFENDLRVDWDKKTVREPWDHERAKALDKALLATINIAHVGMVLPYRRGWVFCAEDASA